MIPNQNRCWYQFSLRTMFVAIALISIALAWVGYQLRWIEQRRELARQQPPFPPGTMICPTTWTPWPLRYFGEHGRAHITWRPDAPYTKAEAKRLFPEAIISEVP